MSDVNKIVGTVSESRLNVLRDDSGKLLLTDDQRKAVLEKGRILVSASAGSGKTSTMVKRIILMVAEGASLKNMLILVYNNAAADELKEKLHRELFKVACRASGDLREHFRSELDELAFCHICTIHAFCQSLIRENFDKLGLSPTFEVLDENAHALYMNKALDEIISEYTANGDEAFCGLADIFSQSRKEENLKSNIIKFYSLIEIQPNKEDFVRCIDDCYGDFENSRFWTILSDYYSKFFKKAELAFSELREQMIAIGGGLGKYIESVTDAAYNCRRMSEAKDFREVCAIASVYEKPKAVLRNASDEEKTLVGFAKDYYKTFEDAMEELKTLFGKFDELEEAHEQNGRYVRKLVEVACAFEQRLSALKAQDNVLSFEDLQHKAMELLSHEEYGLSDAFDAVFVDEYQDVNPMQEAIISSLVRGECFMVGDVKQSIYGFRLADPAIFISRQRRYADFGEKEGINISFNHNFRSAYAILNFVNGVFDSVMTKDNADIDYKKEARFELKDIPPVNLESVSPEGYVQVHLFVKPKAESEGAHGLYDITSAQDEEVGNAKAEGLFIANEIKTLVGRAKGVDENGNGKYLSYGDIAVLFRSRSNGAKEIVQTLKDEGIPVNEGAFGKSVSLPERELMSFLRVLDNPRQDIAFAGYLLSFFGGYDEGELALVASYDGACLYDKFRAVAFGNKDLSPRAKQTLEALDRYRLKASFRSVAELMNDIVSDYCYDAYLMRGGEGNVYGLKAFIAGATGKEGLSLGRFVEEYCEGSGDNFGSAGGDRVTISTFHGYKGLENPVVFVSDCAFGFNYEASSGDLILTGKGLGGSSDENNKGLVGMNAFDLNAKTKSSVTLSKLAVAKCIKENQIKEEIRLFYVALTRAKQLMYVTATVSENKCAGFGTTARLGGIGCDLDFISDAVFDGSVKTLAVKHYSDEIVSAKAARGEFVNLPFDENIAKELAAAQNFEYPHKEATGLAMKYSVTALDSIQEQVVCLYEEAAKSGTAYHKVMQYIDYGAQNEDAVRGEIERMVQDKLMDKDEADRVDTAVIFRCLQSDIIRLARNAEAKGGGRCQREKAFMMYKPACDVSDSFGSKDKVLVQGVIDLFINDDERIIVDFKNSTLTDEKTVEKYRRQLYLYKSAVESAIGAKIDRVVLYSFKTGEYRNL